MADVAVRAATDADLDQVYDVFFREQVAGAADPPPRGEVPSFLRHLLATGEMRVAEREGRVVGFTAVITRGGVSYLAELFVRAEEQSSGVGGLRLAAALPAPGSPVCTVASSDPRALALYVRAGMTPRWPMLWLRAETARLAPLPRGDVTVAEAQAGDAALVAWDGGTCGRYRPEDHRHWGEEQGIPVWFKRAGVRVGYGYLQTRSGSALWSRDAITIGPLGVLTAADAADAVPAAVEYARARSGVVRLALPGPHPALPALLGAGFRITDLGTFVAAPSLDLPDPTRYLPSDDLL